MSDAKRKAALAQTLETHGQDHVLRFFDQLTEAQQQSLLDQIESVDWQEVTTLIDSHVRARPQHDLPKQLEPAPYYPNKPAADLEDQYTRARQQGEQLIATGKVAAFTVAGGQGTRLGYPGPKGTFPATPIAGLCLFELSRPSKSTTAPCPGTS